jgi:hypothetical protein
MKILDASGHPRKGIHNTKSSRVSMYELLLFNLSCGALVAISAE